MYKAPRRRATTRKARPRRLSQRDLQRKHIRVAKSVRTVQLALREAKCYPGKIDGKIGEKTIGGIRAFQRKNRLNADGVVGKATWKKLEVYVPAGGAADFK